MKQKFLMLLGSASAFAQSGNNEPLKGDVNGDGKVDVADIVAIIDIMKIGGGSESEGELYFYIGTTQPTPENYKTIGTKVTEYPSEIYYDAEELAKYYILVASNKTVELDDPDNGTELIIIVDTSVSIDGYKVYKTQGYISSEVRIKIY